MTRARFVVTALVLLAAISEGRGQTPQTSPPRERQAPSAGTATLGGTVLSDETQPRPIRRARVYVGSVEVSIASTVMTDDRGRFVVANLPAGRYAVSVSKPSWIGINYGAKQPRRPGTPVPVADGANVAITVRMMRGAVVTGVILDQNGQPESNAAVSAMVYSFRMGERRLLPYGGATTDDRGTYRIFGLPPGDYLVSASSRAMPGGLAGAEVRLTTDLDIRHAMTETAEPPPADRTVAIAPTYYPGTAVESQAALLSVRAGEERGGIDFALQMVPTVRVEGTVVSPLGSAGVEGTQVTLTSNGSDSTASPLNRIRATRARDDGSFVFFGIPPGPYALLARTTVRPAEGAPPGTRPQVLWGSSDLIVEGDNVSGVAVTLAPALTLTGRIAFEGSPASAPDFKAVRVSLQPAQVQAGASMAPGTAVMEADGRFAIPGVTPARYRLTALLPPPLARTWVLRSSIVNGQDTLDAPITIQPGQQLSEAAVTFTDHMAQLTGTLQNAAGGATPDYTVILFPPDQAMWFAQSRRIQATRPSADGAFTFRNLPAGNYLLAAVDDVEQGEWFDPGFLQRLQPAAMPIAIREGEQKVQDVRVGG